MSQSLRSTRVTSLLKNFKRLESSSSKTQIKDAWTDFNFRPTSLKIDNDDIKKGVFDKINEQQGPHSIENYTQKLSYHSPNEIDETFKQAYEILQHEANIKYTHVKGMEKKLSESNSTESTISIQNRIDQLLTEAELYNPEVLYNVEFNKPESLDKSHPVYRHYLKQKWEKYDLMITMQRLEQLGVIPDTLPTLNPKADVKVKFPHNSESQFSNWIVPGEVLPAFAVEQPPTVQIQEFETVNPNQLYTVIVVNPDSPDLSTNSFSTTLHYGLQNIPLNNVNNIIDCQTLLNDVEDKFTFKSYVPLLPEKNAGKYQRACLWVFRQSEPLQLSSSTISSEKFDIRQFVASNNLNPIGAHVWRQVFDRSVPEIRQKYGLPKGRVFHRVRGTDPIIE
ncbi:Mrpl35 protein [Scheffersomyces coipomensis]|uniref:Mrpl35 protein n=1 Tax=Scheffersomyces coipomensis TaxID=1788519 RepID=UPI00315DCDAB